MYPFRGRKSSTAEADPRRMARRLGPIVAVLVALAAASAAFAGDPRDPQRHFNPADQAWAHRIIVQHADLGAGDWRVQQLDGQGDASAPSYCKSPNLSDLVLTGEAKNPDFGREDSFEDSEAEVWATERDAIASWNHVRAFPFARCFKVAMEQEFAHGSGIKFTILSSGPLAIGKLAPRQLTYGLRFRMTVERARSTAASTSISSRGAARTAASWSPRSARPPARFRSRSSGSWRSSSPSA